MPTARIRFSALALWGLAVGLGFPIGLKVQPVRAADSSTCKYFSQLPDDCARAEQRKFNNLRGYRYEEINLYARDALKKVPYVSIYNTTGQNGGDDTRDSAPKELVGRLDLKKIAKQYQALAVTTSPPLYWTIDWLADRFGAVRNLDGLDAAWMGDGQAPAAKLASGQTPANKRSPKAVSDAYRPAFVARSTIEGFKKGSQVYLLDDPKGRTWIMVSYTDKNHSGMTIDKLDSLGDDLKLPQGWKFRSAVLSKDLILEPKGGSAGRTQDDDENVYALTGPGQSNLVP